MKYKIYQSSVKQKDREEFNRKLLKLIDNKETEKYGITGDDVYNAYTGDGGLHGLNRKDYDSYYTYSEEKKNIENGQFFTPPKLAELLVSSVAPSKDETVADLTCGAGAFFNFLPNEHNLYGCETDIKAYKVAKFLYPDANIENCDIRLYNPDMRFDYVMGNPPFNLKWWIDGGTEIKSQMYFCLKAAALLKPKGIMAVIVPNYFLSDEFMAGSDIADMEKRFNFLGQVALPADSFSATGVNSYDTKIQYWQRKSETDTETKPYKKEMSFTVLKNGNYDEIAAWIKENILSSAQSELRKNRYGILREIAKDGTLSSEFEYRVKSMLYQVKCHPKLKEHYNKCSEYLYRFAHQEKSVDMDYKEWCKKRITEAKVIAYLKNVIKKRKRIALIE